MKGEAFTYWLTRDSDEGVLSPVVDVWLERPVRDGVPGSAFWLGPRCSIAARYGTFRVETVRTRGPKVCPESDRECIRVDTFASPGNSPWDSRRSPAR